MKNGLEDYYVIKNNKKLRYGYTTGSCAAAAAKAAARMLLTGETVENVDLMTPKGILLHLEILDIHKGEEEVSCAVRKDGGDDPDATHGLLVYAAVRKKKESGVTIDGGRGVGRVTKRGLEQPVGAAAINRTPRAMITEAVEDIADAFGYTEGFTVVISIPGGEEVAKKTFNPRLGILGGISVLRTSGIVVPMSEDALIASIHAEMRLRKENGGDYLLITPGNYGAAFVSSYPDVDVEVVPGITSALSGAAVLGAPLMHDFCLISLSDLLTPWEQIERRLACAAAGDFVICLYNPSSKKRADYLRRACEILLREKSAETVCGWVRNIGREGQQSKILTLGSLRDENVDMFTTVFIGASTTQMLSGRMVTPRGYEAKR